MASKVNLICRKAGYSPAFPIFETMKKLFLRLQITPGFLLFVMLFAYLDSIRSRITPGALINAYTFTPEGAIAAIPGLLVIIVLLRFFFQKIHGDSFPFRWQKGVVSFALGLLAWMLLSNLFSLIISLAFGNYERNFTPEVLISNNFSKVLDFMVYGSFYFAFLFFQKFQKHQKILAAYDVALAESTINQLKQHLNPHFLFNNLNILDQLIEENPIAASEFLHDFSELYRYALEKSERKLVDLQEELTFAEQYFRLIRHKYGDAYRLSVVHERGKDYLIPPFALQLLIENAVFHNHGTKDHPVTITIGVQKHIHVSNELRPFQFKKHSGGRGLENLRRQYELLSQDRLQINQNAGNFEVVLPLIPATKE
jgi:hypothetical protein